MCWPSCLRAQCVQVKLVEGAARAGTFCEERSVCRLSSWLAQVMQVVLAPNAARARRAAGDGCSERRYCWWRAQRAQVEQEKSTACAD